MGGAGRLQLISGRRCNVGAAEQSFRAGNIAAALVQLQQEIKQRPAEPSLRIFLAQLLMVEGQWDRALNQLKVIEELDASALPMVRTYQTAIQCERLRTSVFAGERAPLLLGDPEPWIAMLIQGLGLLGKGHVNQAADLRAQALDLAPATPGVLNGEAFDWIADADSRLGPVLEVLVNGNYYWVPWHRISRLVLEPPSDVRDLVFVPAQFTWTNGGEALGLIPTSYVGTQSADDAALRMGRKTIWQELDEATFVGIGQRVLTTNNTEVGLLDVREIMLTAERE